MNLKIKKQNIKIKIQKYNGEELFYFFSYSLIMIFSIWDIAFLNKYLPYTLLELVSLTCIEILVIKELLISKMNFKALIAIVICTFLAILVMKNSSGFLQSTVAFSLFFIYAGRNINFHKIAIHTIILNFILLFMIVILSKTGIILNYISCDDGRKREFLGFLYTLYPATIAFNITALYIYIKKRSLSFGSLLFLCLFNLWFFFKTDARLIFASSIIIILFAIIMKIIKNHEKIRCFFAPMIFAFPVCFFLSIYLTLSYSSAKKWMYELNIFLSHRLSLGRASLIGYGYKIFGQKINWIGMSVNSNGQRNTSVYNYVDSLYIQILQRYGVIFTVLFLGLMTMVCFMCFKRKNYYLLFILFILAIHGIIDDLILYMYFNTFWFAIGNEIMNNFQIENNIKR